MPQPSSVRNLTSRVYQSPVNSQRPAFLPLPSWGMPHSRGALVVIAVLALLLACGLPHGNEPPDTRTPPPPQDSIGLGGGACCSVQCPLCQECRMGKACGDVCISKEAECTSLEPGCACDAP
jgi:hypothetical protein